MNTTRLLVDRGMVVEVYLLIRMLAVSLRSIEFPRYGEPDDRAVFTLEMYGDQAGPEECELIINTALPTGSVTLRPRGYFGHADGLT